MLTIWHNPRCSKSRQTLARIEAAGQEVTIRLYLVDGPSADEIMQMKHQLGLDDIRAMMRVKDDLYKNLGLADVPDEQALIEAMAANSALIERPIVTNGQRAIIGRPPEAVDLFLN